MCLWIAAAIHHVLEVRLADQCRLGKHDLVGGLARLGLGHLYVPLDPYLESHAVGAWAPGTAAGASGPPTASTNLASSDDLPLLSCAPPWQPPPCADFVAPAVLDRFADRRTKALIRRSDLQLGRPMEPTAARFCRSFSRPLPRAPALVEEPRFHLTTLDTARHGTGATRRERFRF